MALFIEVTSVEKNCKVIVNLDSIVEIAPLSSGGCVLFVSDSAATGGKTPLKVQDSYELFKQFAMQTVSADDIAARFPTKRGPGRPPKVESTENTPVVTESGHPGVTW